MDKNIFEQAERLISRSIIEQYFNVPGAKWKGPEFWTLSPLRDDKNIKSGTFSINESGLYKDLSTGDGGNLIQLVASKFRLSLKEAAEKIINDAGQSPVKSEYKKDQKSNDNKKLPAIIPIPEGVDEALIKTATGQYWQDRSGELKKVYNYKSLSGDRYFVTCRFEKPHGKEGGKPTKQVLPFHYTSKGWRAGRPELKKGQRFPLYRSHHLSKPENIGKKIIVVEGEKCAAVDIPGYILISWIGGTNSIDKCDWSVLNGKDVIIWYDYDQKRWSENETEKARRYNQYPGDLKPDIEQPGFKAAVKIKTFIEGSEILDIKTGLKDRAVLDGWDIADAEQDGVDLINFIEKCPRIYDRSTPGTPYEAFKLSIDDIYGNDNIDQFDGLYYFYNNKKHYWEERLQINIESDLQKWIEKNHIEFLTMSETAIHTFVGNTASFLKRYSNNYYKMNPFKEAALSPYLHFQNGAVKINDDGFEYIDRQEKGEQYFKNLYPVHCMEFDYDESTFENCSLQETAPAFYYYIDSLIPNELEGEMRELELENTIDFYSQVIAYCLNPVKRRPRFFAMYGNQDSGKSFLIEIMQKIIGEQFFVVRKTKDMEGRFASSDLWGSKIFVDDDVRSDLTLPDDFIKLYSGMKSVTIEKKNKDAIKGVKISVAMFFISNHVFSLSGGNEGIARRVIYMPYNKTIPKVDLFLLDKIIGRIPKGHESGKYEGKTFDERPAIIGLALRGLQKLIRDNHEFTMPMWVSIERDDWIVQSDSVNQFLVESIFDDDFQSDYEFRKVDLLEKYKIWCNEEERKPYGKKKFYSKIKQLGGVERHRNSGDYFEFPDRKSSGMFKSVSEKKESETFEIPY